MSVSLVLLVVMAVMFACGVYLLLERSMTRVLLGFLLVGNATNLLILIMGGKSGIAPILGDGATVEEMSDPLPQALILTAIVITFGVSAFLMALIYRSWRLSKDDEVDDDADDVAMRDFASGVPAEELVNESDTEFGLRAEAAISEARDLEVQDEIAAERESDSSTATPAAPPRERSARKGE
jgi:multisubunit Na+/H+ antiporter MnhC subunit